MYCENNTHHWKDSQQFLVFNKIIYSTKKKAQEDSQIDLINSV